jgi:hypothetical protein
MCGLRDMLVVIESLETLQVRALIEFSSHT